MYFIARRVSFSQLFFLQNVARFMTLNRHLHIVLFCKPCYSSFVQDSSIYHLILPLSQADISDRWFLSGCELFSPGGFFHQWDLDSISSYSSAALPAFHSRDLCIIYQLSFLILALQLLHYALILVLFT